MYNKKKLIEKGWFIVLMTILFFPAGLTLLWLNKGYSKKKKIVGTSLFLGLLLIGFVGNTGDLQENKEVSIQSNKVEDIDKVKEDEVYNNQEEMPDNQYEVTTNSTSGELKLHVINVGQADSILVQQGNEFMLVDAGNNADSNTVKAYLDSVGVKELKYAVGTHAHEDHIGGLDYIINSFKVGQIYMPKQISTTRTFEDVVSAAQNRGLQFTAPKVGATFMLGEAKCTIVGPKSDSYEDINNSSIVLKIEYKDTSFLLTGDAEDVSEREMINSGISLKADVLKIGHHGSSSSTTSEFLIKVNPKYALLSVGKDNTYNHPNEDIMNRLKKANIPVYRTDESGTIIVTSNGKEISFNTQAGSYNGFNGGSTSSGGGTTSSGIASSTGITTNEPAPSGIKVYWTSGGKSYHYSKGCPTLSRSKNILEGDSKNCPKTDPCNKCVK